MAGAAETNVVRFAISFLAVCLAATLGRGNPANQNPNSTIRIESSESALPGFQESIAENIRNAMRGAVQVVETRHDGAAGSADGGAVVLGTNEVAITIDFESVVATNAIPTAEIAADMKRATVHAALLQPVEASRDEIRRELWLRRIEKQTLFVASRMMGKASCVFPLCVMNPEDNIDAIDMKARDYCPPCMLEMGALLGWRD